MHEIILTVIYTVFFLLLMHWIPFFRKSNIRFGWLIIFFLGKFLSGEIAWWMYTYVPYFQDSSDAFRYFTDGRFLYEGFFRDKSSFFSVLLGGKLNNPAVKELYSQMVSWNKVYETGWLNDNRTMIRFNAIVDFISLSNYHVNLLITNILSFTGLIHIYNFFNRFIDDKRKGWLILTLFVMPCLVFWGSIVSKEALAIFAMGIILSALGKASWYRPGIMAYLKLLLGLLLLFTVKYYLLFLLIPLLLAYLFNEKENCPTPANRYMTYVSWFFTLVMLLNLILPSFDPAYWLIQQQKNFFGLAHFRNLITPLSGALESNSVISLLIKSPIALLSGLVGMYFPPVTNFWSVIAMIENTLILALIVWLLSAQIEDIWRNNLVSFFLIFIILDLIVIGFTTPYAGAIHRYRILTLPLFLSALSCNTARIPFPFLQTFHTTLKRDFNK